MSIQIVSAGPGDIADAGRVHAESWRESHRSFCTPAFVALHTAKRQAQYLSDKLAHGAQLYLLRLDGRAAGIVSVTGNLIEDLYILPDCQNRGLGTALLRYAVSRCEGLPTLWILENNVNAARLYHRLGFRETGGRKNVTHGLDEVEMMLTEGDRS